MSDIQRPIPAPRRIKQIKETDEVDKAKTSYENVQLAVKKPAEIYENVQIIKKKDTNNEVVLEDKISNLNNTIDTNPPKPAPRKKLSGTEKELGKSEKSLEAPKKYTGAIRKAPVIPLTTVHNNLNEHQSRKDNTEQEVHKSPVSQRDRSSSIHSSNSGQSLDSSTFYKTSSPKDILKSLGATSKLLSESITERAKHKIDKNLRKSKEKVEIWTSEKKKTAQKKFKRLTSTKINKDIDIVENNIGSRKSMPVTNELFKDISFTSPLCSKTNNIEDLSRLSIYEVPKINKRVKEPLPTYEDIIKEKQNNTENWDRLEFKRNDLLTMSMGKLNTNKKPHIGPLPLKLVRNKSDTNLQDTTTSDSSASTSSTDSIPCPSYPAPLLPPEGIYGKIKKINRSFSDESDEELVVLRDKDMDTAVTTRATFDINEDNSLSIASSAISKWSYIDPTALEHDSSSPEPIYVNNNPVSEDFYENMSEMKTNLLQPITELRTSLNSNSERDEANNIIDSNLQAIQEFDPLVDKNGTDGLNLIQNLLNGDNYTTVVLNSSDRESIQSGRIPTPPERFDSLPINNDETMETPPLPLSMLRKKKKPSNAKEKSSIIVHQNLQLKDSMENIFDESEIEPYLAQVTETNQPQEPVDLRKPSKLPHKTTVWHDIDGSPTKFEKSAKIDPINTKISNNQEKVNKAMLPMVNDIQEELPTYNEAIGGTDIPITPPPSTSFRSKFANLLGGIKRGPNVKKDKSEVKTILEMIPRPPINEKYVSYRGNLLKLPSGALEDLMKELNPRYVELRDQRLVTFQDQNLTQMKESFPLKYISSIQTVISNKFNSESGMELHCFEINIAVPKVQGSSLSNANMVLTSTNSGNTKTQKSSYIYGVYRKNERNLAMKKILDAFIDKFPENYTTEFIRAGWCYIKKSVSSQWAGAWMVLCRRRLLFYNFVDKVIENLDLRKARLLQLKENDDSTSNLHVEKGPCFLIDCPPYTTLYMIMDSPKETKMWKAIVKDAAHSNGASLKQQQLTKENVPVLIDKCINFIYVYGSMTEGIYRKVGSASNVQKLLKSFRTDAFAVELTRAEYSEHDASSCLKKFMRELPQPLLGTQSMQFIAVSDMRSEQEKVKAYQELLERLPSVEYQTLKKIIGHLHFIESQKIRNKMNIDNLAMIWGPTLIRNPQFEEVQYSQKECDVIKDLIQYFKALFPLQNEEIRKEQIMLSVLKKYHEAAENLSDVKKSGDLRIWIAIDSAPDSTEEEKLQINVTITPLKTVYEVCKELSPKLKLEPYKITMYEIICNKELERPMHYNEKVLDTIVRWTGWPEDDRKNNCLVLRPTKFLNEVERALTITSTVAPNSEVRFADRKSKNLKPYVLELSDSKITVMKREKQSITKIRDINLHQVIAYIGCESKREQQLRWAITLIEHDFKKRTKDSPYIGLVFGNELGRADLLLWYSNILHALHKSDVLPQPDLVIP